ncbi:MAG: methionyl-tRNA formyltransferase [Chloroflexi bacterium]|nr:methionyl-tRNA formyltransferase [Chloroflexota bacterium]
MREATEIRIVFMGTPEFSVPSLRALVGMQHIDARPIRVVGVFTQPDRPAGRGQKLTAPPVKTAALEAGIRVFQPERLRQPDALAQLIDLKPDLIVVVAYAQILPKTVLELPRYGCLNVHASLLPQYRGASPIQAAILDGLADTGVSVMKMDEGLDTGPVLSQVPVPIDPRDTCATLTTKLSAAGAGLLASTLPGWIAGTTLAKPQDDSQATITRLIKKEHGIIDWTLTAVRIEHQVRAMYPWPTAFTHYEGGPLKVLKASVMSGAPEYSGDPGSLLVVEQAPVVGTGSGLLILEVVQPAGRRPMPASDWLRGAPHVEGTVLGTPEIASKY